MVGVQATQNVLLGQRYKNIAKEIKSYIRGEYGTAPGEINEGLKKQVLGDVSPITGRFADTLEPVFEKTKEKLNTGSDEDVLSQILFPGVADKFFKRRQEKEENIVSYTIEAI